MPLNDRQVDSYLERIGLSSAGAPSLEQLTTLQLAHLQTAPFENIRIAAGNPVRTDDEWTFGKVVEQRRGGWCFELNGAFAQLLEALGYTVRRLGAAVLLTGPTTVIDHLVLEVSGLQHDPTESYLVEVGFGDQAPIEPLPLAQAGPIETRDATFEFLASPQGTTLAEVVDGTPEARYRFKRVSHQMSDFSAISEHLQSDPELHWSRKPFATRLLDDAGSRITLTHHGLKTRRNGVVTEESVAVEEWHRVLAEQFGIDETVPLELLRP